MSAEYPISVVQHARGTGQDQQTHKSAVKGVPELLLTSGIPLAVRRTGGPGWN